MMEETIKLPNEKRMLALAKAINETKTKVGNLNKDVADRVAEAVDSGNMNKPALSFLAALMRTEELKAKERIAHFRFAIEVFEAYLAKNGHAGDLVNEMNADEAEQRAEAERKANGAKVLAGIKPIPDKKGRGISKDKAAKAKAEEPATEEEPADKPAATTDEEWNAAAPEPEPEPEKPTEEAAPETGNVTPLRVGGGRQRRPTISTTAGNA